VLLLLCPFSLLRGGGGGGAPPSENLKGGSE
jgi:hypothetical protein